jgi:VanZ family protein
MHTILLHHHRWWLIIGGSLILLVIYLSLAPHPPHPNVAIPFSDKVGHGLAYFTLMSWFAQLYQTPRQRRYLAIGFILLGGGLEIVQGLGGVRMADLWDFAANTSGVLLSWWIVTFTKLGMILSRIEQRWFKCH